VALDVADRAQDIAEDVGDSPWAERIGRLGLCSRGAIYCVVFALALQVAFGPDNNDLDRRGALRSIAHQPLGKVALVVLAVGFASYAAWRLLKAATGAGEGGGKQHGGKGAVKRLADVGRALIYLSLLVSTVKLLAHSSPGGGGDKEAQDWSARFMEHASGRWLVVAAGAALVVTGVVLLVRAFMQKFDKHLDMAQMTRWQRTWLPRLGTVGYAARGVVAGLVGAFVVQAGLAFDAHKAVGIDGALKRLAHWTFGPAYLTVIAVGLLAFGLFSFVEARWRKILDDH
jgi:hypothetical protein